MVVKIDLSDLFCVKNMVNNKKTLELFHLCGIIIT